MPYHRRATILSAMLSNEVTASTVDEFSFLLESLQQTGGDAESSALQKANKIVSHQWSHGKQPWLVGALKGVRMDVNRVLLARDRFCWILAKVLALTFQEEQIWVGPN